MELAAYVGLDWADRTHAVCLESADGSVVEELELEQKPEAIHAWVGQLREQFGGRPVGIGPRAGERRADSRPDDVRVYCPLSDQSESVGPVSGRPGGQWR